MNISNDKMILIRKVIFGLMLSIIVLMTITRTSITKFNDNNKTYLLVQDGPFKKVYEVVEKRD